MAISLCSESGNRVKVKVTQSCPTLCDPMDCSPWNSPGQNPGVVSAVDEYNSLCPYLCIVGTNLSTSKSAAVNECVRIYLKTYVSNSQLSMMIYLKII